MDFQVYVMTRSQAPRAPPRSAPVIVGAPSLGPVSVPPATDPTTVRELAVALGDFADRRGWRPEHAPKNLAMALVAEAGELAAEFQWLTLEDSEAVAKADHPSRAAVEDELADVMLYLTRLADILGVDLLAVAAAKLRRNEDRFPPPA